MESQIVQTKNEANQNLGKNEPMKTPGTRYTSEPMTIKISNDAPARPLMIDPRNQGDST